MFRERPIRRLHHREARMPGAHRVKFHHQGKGSRPRRRRRLSLRQWTRLLRSPAVPGIIPVRLFILARS
jgi:hypothetical protein